MTATPTRRTEVDSPGEVLGAVRASKAAENVEAARQLRLAVDWAAMHSVDSIHDAATLWAPRLGFEEEAVPVAGPGAPLVAEFCVAEFAAALGVPTEVGRLFLGEALELRYRLPRLWRRVTDGDLPAWRARRIARETLCLSHEAAGYVDRHVGPVAHKVGPAQTQRLVEEAIARFMPETAEETRRRAADSRHFTIEHDQVSFAGTSLVHGELDLADALDLDQAIRGIADHLKDLGSTESLDVRRSVAVGDLARRQLALDLQTGDCGGTADRGSGRGGRSPCSCTCTSPPSRARGGVGRVENTRSPVTVEQIRDLVRPPRRPGGREAGARPGRPRPRRGLRGPRPDRRTGCASRPTSASSRGAPGPPAGSELMNTAATATTSCPTAGQGRPARATSRPCAGDTTGSRPTAAGPTPSSNPAPTSGRPRTATSTSATTKAPSTSAVTDAHPHPAPDE